MTRAATQPRRGLVLIGERGPRYVADVVLDGPWVHLTNVVERSGAYGTYFHDPRADRSLRARDVREIRWDQDR